MVTTNLKCVKCKNEMQIKYIQNNSCEYWAGGVREAQGKRREMGFMKDSQSGGNGEKRKKFATLSNILQ